MQKVADRMFYIFQDLYSKILFNRGYNTKTLLESLVATPRFETWVTLGVSLGET
jgi:hypothetical protein